MVPKIIHYCWFGGKPLPNSARKCIASWRKFFPDYEIKEWNETNFDINCCEYIKEAYNQKKWAFVSDYARFWILYYYGGLYFDTDVEVIKDMTEIIQNGAFMGCEGSEIRNLCENVAPGLGLAANPGLELYKEILDYYSILHFNSDNIETVVEHVTKILKEKGFKGNGLIEDVAGIKVYPSEYFCPMNYQTGRLNITEKTHTIHWYTASWQTPYSRFKTKLQHMLGKRLTNIIIKLKKEFK